MSAIFETSRDIVMEKKIFFRKKWCSRAEKIQVHLLYTWTDQWSLKSSANELSEDQNKQATSNDSSLNKQRTEILINDNAARAFECLDRSHPELPFLDHPF